MRVRLGVRRRRERVLIVKSNYCSPSPSRSRESVCVSEEESKKKKETFIGNIFYFILFYYVFSWTIR